MAIKKPTIKNPKAPVNRMFIVTQNIGSKNISDYDGIFESESEVQEHIEQMGLTEDEKVEVLELTDFKTFQLVCSLVEVKE